MHNFFYTCHILGGLLLTLGPGLFLPVQPSESRRRRLLSHTTLTRILAAQASYNFTSDNLKEKTTPRRGEGGEKDIFLRPRLVGWFVSLICPHLPCARSEFPLQTTCPMEGGPSQPLRLRGTRAAHVPVDFIFYFLYFLHFFPFDFLFPPVGL